MHSTLLIMNYQVEGLVLVNSAGPIDSGFNIQRWEEQARSKGTPPKALVMVCGPCKRKLAD